MAKNSHEETRKVAKLKPHPFAKKVLGAPSQHEVKEMAADMKEKGQRTAIDILPDGTILDGLTRWLAAKEAGITELRVIVHEFDDDAAKKFILGANLLRHHYDKLTFARVYLEWKTLIKGDDGKSPNGDGDLRDRLAKRFKISGRTLDRHVKMLGTPAEAQRLYREGKLSDGVMVALATLTADQQKDVLAAVVKVADIKKKNLAAKNAIATFRAADKAKRAADKVKREAAATAKAEADKKAIANGDTPPPQADTEEQVAAEPEAAGEDPAGDVVHGDEAPGEPTSELPTEEVADDDHGETADDAGDGGTAEPPELDESVVSAEVDPEAAAEGAGDDDPVDVYRRMLEDVPIALDELAQHVDDIAGEAMDSEAAVEILDRMAARIKVLREAEEAFVEVPA